MYQTLNTVNNIDLQNPGFILWTPCITNYAQRNYNICQIQNDPFVHVQERSGIGPKFFIREVESIPKFSKYSNFENFVHFAPPVIEPVCLR